MQPAVPSQLPDRADLPAKRAADRLESRPVDLDRRIRFGEDLCDLVPDALQDSVSAIMARTSDNRHGHERRCTPTEGEPEARSLRIAVADDDALLREGIASPWRTPVHRSSVARQTPTTCC